jgi:transcriptional regulator with XRE-family HTH domain
MEKKTRKDFDLRYSRDRYRYQEAKSRGEIADKPPPHYDPRAFYEGTNKPAVGLLRYTPEYRDLAARVGLSVNTVRDVLGGRAVKLEPVFVLAEYYGVDPLRLFDTAGRLKWNDKGELVGVNKPKPGSRNADKVV